MASKINALINKRGYVVPHDIKTIALRELEKNNCPDFVQDFCSSSRRDDRCIVNYVPVITT
jgi:hypothetical protein